MGRLRGRGRQKGRDSLKGRGVLVFPMDPESLVKAVKLVINSSLCVHTSFQQPRETRLFSDSNRFLKICVLMLAHACNPKAGGLPGV